MVDVFKTNILKKKEAKLMVTILSKKFPSFKVNFDLHDCDKILRVQGKDICNEKIVTLINATGFQYVAFERRKYSTHKFRAFIKIKNNRK